MLLSTSSAIASNKVVQGTENKYPVILHKPQTLTSHELSVFGQGVLKLEATLFQESLRHNN